MLDCVSVQAMQDDFGEGEPISVVAKQELDKKHKAIDLHASNSKDEKVATKGWRGKVDPELGLTVLLPSDINRPHSGIPICDSCGPVKSDAIYTASEGHWTCRNCSYVIDTGELLPAFEQECQIAKA